MIEGADEVAHLSEEGHADRATFRGLNARLARISAQVREIERLKGNADLDIRQFVESLRIINKRGEMVPLIMNPPQEIVFNRLMDYREKHKPGRFICLKSRQMGISTLVEAFIFALITLNPNRSGLVVAHSVESSRSIFSMTQRFFLQYTRANEIIPAISARRIEYPSPRYSRMQIDTASNRNLGRGGTLHYVHASEVAFWQRPQEPMLAISQAVPLHWDTLVFWESTANGAQNLFHRSWMAAERGDSDFEPIFLSWKLFPEYSLPVACNEELSLSPAEEEYSTTHDLSPQQAEWARFTKRNQCRNSWDMFHQEYPVAAALAFTFSGLPWFDPQVVQEMLEAEDRPPVTRGALKFGEDNSPEFSERAAGPIRVWQFPESGCTYSLGMDVGEGVGGDFTVIQVICNETTEVVARYSSNRVHVEAAGVDAYLLGLWYNNGLLGIERNGPGLAVLAVCERGLSDYPHMTGYPNLYYHTFTDRRIPEETRRLGWVTNRVTKESMLSRLSETVADRGLIIYSQDTLFEMQGFYWDAERNTFRQNYRAPGAAVAHDDEIMALAIANEMRSHCFKRRFFSANLPKGSF
jgi:hypothetical protein